MKRRFLALGVLLFGIILFSCIDENNESPPGRLPAEARDAAQLLLSNLTVSDSAEIFVVGPVAAGSELRERVADTTAPAIILSVPDSVGSNYVFYINDHPDLGFSHAVRYAWVNLSCSCMNVIGAQWSPVLNQPGIAPASFHLIAAERINGKSFNYGTGSGIAATQNASQKPDDIVPPAPPSTEDQPCQKLGFVLDFGDGSSWGKGDGSSADNMAESADLVQSFLEGNGFTVKRTSQYSGNTLPGFFPHNGNDDAMNTTLRSWILSYASQLGCPCAGDRSCHEFFLYISAHGNEHYLELHEPGGPGVTSVTYNELNIWVTNFLPCVKVILFVDACHSGAAIGRFSNQCNLRGDCGFTMITTCDSTHGTPTGDGLTDSGTEDWSQGTGDLDHDGKEGDLGDRWLNLADENSDYNPQRFLCPNQTSMCSTD
jgi:hypothetical protein